MLLVSCEEVTTLYPDEPVMDYQAFGLFISEDALGNKVTLWVGLPLTLPTETGILAFFSLMRHSNPLAPDSTEVQFLPSAL